MSDPTPDEIAKLRDNYRTAWHALNALAYEGNHYAQRIVEQLPRPPHETADLPEK